MNSISLNKSQIKWIKSLLMVCIMCVSLILGSASPAFATIRQIEESPSQMLYQSRQNLLDDMGNSWQTIAFKRTYPERSATVSLRLISLFSEVDLDHNQPLILTTSLGKTLSAKDISSTISKDKPPLGSVGEYDFNSVLSQLQAEIPVNLTLSTTNGESISLSVPSAVIKEWKKLITN
nr:hypothetical protein A5482_05275 [Cyanobacterium sp. IPPAS B-1200]